MSRWRITLLERPISDDLGYAVKLNRMILDVTINEESNLPQDVASRALASLSQSGYTQLELAGIEPISEAGPANLGRVDREEVAKFLKSIGYFDEQEERSEG